jgi:nitrous oxidase accessory protein
VSARLAGRWPRRAGSVLAAVVALAGSAAFAGPAALAGARADAAPAFQPLVDATPTGGELHPAPGVYAGPVVIDRPMRVDGQGAVTIDNGGVGTVVRIAASGVALRGLRLAGSGANHDTIDAGIRVEGSGNVVEDNRIENCLFGIDLAQSNENVVRRNRIHSQALEVGMRGDGIRLWYSFRNAVEDNEITDVRDVVMWYSADNRVARNRVRGGRYALHTMYAHKNFIEGNDFRGNMAGIFLMYSDGVELRGNRIQGAQGATGVGIGMKETSGVVAQDNDVIYCAQGLYLDVSPYEIELPNRFHGNRLAYNGIGVTFHSDWEGNEFVDNEFRGNFVQVSVRGGGSARRNVWRANHWDDYEGFDRDGDGTGDTPYVLRAFADRIWLESPPAAFFRASPVLEVIDFLDRLAPFSDPIRVVVDEAPRFARHRRDRS